MKKTFSLLALSVFLSVMAFGQMQATLLDTWDDESLIEVSWLYGSYNDVWGIAINGGEYALIGSTEGVHIVDVTDPNNIDEIFRIDGAAIGTFLAHRDLKTYNGYLYFVARRDATIKCSGYRISPTEIETALIAGGGGKAPSLTS